MFQKMLPKVFHKKVHHHVVVMGGCLAAGAHWSDHFLISIKSFESGLGNRILKRPWTSRYFLKYKKKALVMIFKNQLLHTKTLSHFIYLLSRLLQSRASGAIACATLILQLLVFVITLNYCWWQVRWLCDTFW